jgi:hypothetical protein
VTASEGDVVKVTVVLDPAYGGGRHPPLGPAFWLIESPENRALAERLWSAPGSDPNSAVFQGDRYSSTADAAITIFSNVGEHHPCWTEIEFIGAALDANIRAAFAGEEVDLSPTPLGFTASRLKPL